MALVRTMLELARALDLTTVAEGIEDARRAARARGRALPHGQGFLLARPLDPDQIELFFDNARPRAIEAPSATAAVDETPEAQAMRERVTAMFTPGSLAFRSLYGFDFLRGPRQCNNSPEWRSAELPAANGDAQPPGRSPECTAPSPGMGSWMGSECSAREAVREAARWQARSPDAVLVMETRSVWGSCSRCRASPTTAVPVPSATVVPAGRSLADPDRGVGFGYTMNKMWTLASFMTPDRWAQSLGRGGSRLAGRPLNRRKVRVGPEGRPDRRRSKSGRPRTRPGLRFQPSPQTD